MKKSVKDLIKRKEFTGPDKLWPLVKEKFDLGNELRLPYQQQWVLNLSFLAGRQYVIYNQSVELLQHLVQRKGKLRVVDNKMLPRFQKQVSRLIRNNPRMSVIPSSTDQEDIKAAKTGDSVLKWYWKDKQMRKKIRQLGGWIYSCGNAFLDDVWNPSGGPARFDEKSSSYKYLGDAEVNVWSPFEIGVPAGGMGQVELHDFPWMTKARFLPLEWIQRNFKKGKDVKAEQRPVPYVDMSAIFGGSTEGSALKVDGATVVWLYVQPNNDFPKGKFLVGSNGVILEESDYPFTHYHLEHFKDIDIPGCFWALATAEPARWLQRLWNRSLGDIAEFNRTIAKGKWLIPRASKMEVDPDDSHGQKLLYNPVMGHKPEMMTIKGLPSTYMNMLQMIANSFMELYHQHEVSQGTNKSDIRSGEMVALLLEQDDFGNVPTHAVFEESLEAVMGRVLKRVQKGYTEERVLSITGRDGEHEVFAFKGADLRHNTDVHVAKESSLPDSKTARQFRIKENYKEGLYGDPRDERTRERVLRMLEEVPDDIQDIFKETHLDRQNARNENVNMFSYPGIVYLPNMYDNHQVHVEEHDYHRKQPEYQKMKMEDMQRFGLVETTFEAHLSIHRKFLAEQQKAQEKQIIRMKQLEKGES